MNLSVSSVVCIDSLHFLIKLVIFIVNIHVSNIIFSLDYFPYLCLNGDVLFFLFVCF